MVVAGAGACPSCHWVKDGGYTLDTPTAYPSLSPPQANFFSQFPLTSVCSDCDKKPENRTHVDIRKGHRLRHRTRNLLARRRQCYPRRHRVSQTRKTYHISWWSSSTWGTGHSGWTLGRITSRFRRYSEAKVNAECC